MAQTARASPAAGSSGGSSALPPPPVGVLRGTQGAVRALAFYVDDTADAKRTKLIVGDGAGGLAVWDCGTRRAVQQQVAAHPRGVISVGQVSTCVWSHGRDSTIKVWDTQNLETPKLQIPSTAMSFCPAAIARPLGCSASAKETLEDTTLVLPTDDGRISFLQLGDATTVTTVSLVLPSDTFGMCMHQQAILHTTEADPASPPLLLLLCGWENGHVSLIDARKGRVLADALAFKETLLRFEVDGDGNMIAVGAGTTVAVLHVNVPDARITLKSTFVLPVEGASAVAVRRDNRIVAVGGWDHRLRIYDWRKLVPLAVLEHHKAVLQCVAFSNDNKLLAAAGDDQGISLWALYPPKDDCPASKSDE